jgi:hypothetical protein
MSKLLTTIAVALCAAAAGSAQQKPDLGKVVADLKQSLAKNQAELRAYQWTETTEVALKGEGKKREQSDCRYDADGKVVKTAIGAPAPKKQARGIKGKVVANKVEDIKEYVDRTGSLIRRYVPPNPESIKTAFDAGKVSFTKTSGSGSASVVISDYAKPGDRLTLQLDPSNKRIRSFAVATYLDSPDDAVSLNVNFAAMPDGVSYVEQSVLNMPAKQLQIKTTNFGFHK